MREIKFIIPFILALLSPSLLEAYPRHLSPTEFQSLVESNNGILLDVRTPEEISQERIGDPTALDYYSDDFKKRLALLPRETPLYVYCRSGGRSKATLKILDDLDFENTVDLAGGIGAWKKAKLPTRKSQVSKSSSAHTYTQEEFSAHLSSPTPVLLAFQTKWCAPCRQMKPILDQLEDQEREKLKILRIDLDANPSLSEQYKVDSIPAFILIKNNTPLWQDTGIFTLPKLTQILNTHR